MSISKEEAMKIISDEHNRIIKGGKFVKREATRIDDIENRAEIMSELLEKAKPLTLDEMKNGKG